MLSELFPAPKSAKPHILDHTDAVKHTLVEDIYAFLIGCSFIVLGLVFLKSAGFVTGGVAGIALLVSYVVPWPVGVLFMVINLPFFLFAYSGMGLKFTLKTVGVNIAIMVGAAYAPLAFKVEAVHPAFAALFGGTIIGMGILALARHGAGAGGTGVLSLYLQKTRGINAGRTQIVLDILILSSSLLFIDAHRVFYSVISAAAMSGVMVSYHKPERYKGY